MKLNIHQIMERTPYIFRVLYEKDKGKSEIINVRFFRTGNMTCKEETLYIISEDELEFVQNCKPAHLLFLSQIPVEFPVEEMLSCTQICDLSCSCERIFSDIQDSITWFHTWEQRVFHNILNEFSIKDTLDLCAEALHNPIAVFDLQQNLLFSAGTIPEISSKSALWDYILNHGRSPEENEIESDMSIKLETERTPFYYQSKNQFCNIARLIGPLYHKNSLFGMLALSDITDSFSEGEYLNVRQIQEYMELALAHANEFYFNMHHTPWYIVQLLRGEKVNQEVLDYNIKKTGFLSGKQYFLWTFQRDCTDAKDMENMLPNIAYSLNTNLVYYYANQIVVIDQKLLHYKNIENCKKLHSLLTQNHLRFGQSMIFDNLADIHTAFMQSQIALNQNPDKVENFFIDSYQSYVLRTVNGMEEADGLMHPALKRMDGIHSEYRKELLICLEKYILHGLNVSATAKVMFIHRHTVIYRIEKMESILQIKLQELAETELELLVLSCRRLLSELY